MLRISVHFSSENCLWQNDEKRVLRIVTFGIHCDGVELLTEDNEELQQYIQVALAINIHIGGAFRHNPATRAAPNLAMPMQRAT